MQRKISVIGGDLRIIKLAKMLKNEGFEICTFGLEKAEEILESEKIDSIEKCIQDAKIIISSIPFSKDGIIVNAPFAEKELKAIDVYDKIKECAISNKENINIEHNELSYNSESFIETENKIKIKFIAGNVSKEMLDVKNLEIIDLLENENLTIKNAIPSAEGAIQIAMEESQKTIHGSNILIMGFGRIGKILSKMLNGIGANVYCEARKEADIAWIDAYGYKSIMLQDLQKELPKFDIIFNTIPVKILNRNELEKLKKSCLIIDLASIPGGVDFEVAKELGLKVNWALGLPRKSSTRNSGRIYKAKYN